MLAPHQYRKLRRIWEGYAAHESDAMPDEASIDEASFKFESLPSELRLCCCEFLDAGSLATGDVRGESLIDSKRAWKQLVAGSSRGASLIVQTSTWRSSPRRAGAVPKAWMFREPLPPGDEERETSSSRGSCIGKARPASRPPRLSTSRATVRTKKPQAIAELNVSEYVFNVLPADAHKAPRHFAVPQEFARWCG